MSDPEGCKYVRGFNDLDIDISHLCSDKYHNMLFGCKGPAYVDMVYDQQNVTGKLIVVFFPTLEQPTSLSSYGDCSQHVIAILRWYLEHYDEGKSRSIYSYQDNRKNMQIFSFFAIVLQNSFGFKTSTQKMGLTKIK